MEKVMLKAVTLAAAAIAPHLIAADVKTVEVKQIENLSAEKRLTIEAPTEQYVYSLRKDPIEINGNSTGEETGI